jgi:hypothetical protein
LRLIKLIEWFLIWNEAHAILPKGERTVQRIQTMLKYRMKKNQLNTNLSLYKSIYS